MHKLGDSEREAIVMKIYNGMTFDELGQVHGVSLNTAASWYRRGLEKLRKLMKEES